METGKIFCPSIQLSLPSFWKNCILILFELGPATHFLPTTFFFCSHNLFGPPLHQNINILYWLYSFLNSFRVANTVFTESIETCIHITDGVNGGLTVRFIFKLKIVGFLRLTNSRGHTSGFLRLTNSGCHTSGFLRNKQ